MFKNVNNVLNFKYTCTDCYFEMHNKC